MPISLRRRRAVYAAHRGVCPYCGASGATHVDHIVPRSDGGTDDLSNLILACGPCNFAKGGRRLAPEHEAELLAKAAAVRDVVAEIEKTGRRPRSTPKGGPPERINMLVSKEMRKEIRRFRFANEINSEGEAVRILLRQALRAEGML